MFHSPTESQPDNLADLSLSHIIENGFPTGPLCSAYSPSLSALAVGTQNGEIRVVGNQHVQFLYNLHAFEDDSIFNEGHVSHLAFLAESKSTCKLAAVINYAHLVVLELVK